MFLFPEANRLVVERPQVVPAALALLPCLSGLEPWWHSKHRSCTVLQYASATYLFCLEEPLPISDQVSKVCYMRAAASSRCPASFGAGNLLSQELLYC